MIYFSTLIQGWDKCAQVDQWASQSEVYKRVPIAKNNPWSYKWSLCRKARSKAQGSMMKWLPKSYLSPKLQAWWSLKAKNF